MSLTLLVSRDISHRYPESNTMLSLIAIVYHVWVCVYHDYIWLHAGSSIEQGIMNETEIKVPYVGGMLCLILMV